MKTALIACLLAGVLAYFWVAQGSMTPTLGGGISTKESVGWDRDRLAYREVKLFSHPPSAPEQFVRKVTLLGRTDEVLDPWALVRFTDGGETELVTIRGHRVLVPVGSSVVVADGAGGWVFPEEALPDCPAGLSEELRDPRARLVDRFESWAPESTKTLDLLKQLQTRSSTAKEKG